MGVKETTIQALIRKAICRDGRAIVTRNNTGVLRDERGVPVRFGLGCGSPDLVGMLVPSGRVFCLEIKQPGKQPTVHQKAWARACRARGGFCGLARSVEDAMAALERALRGESQ